MNILLINEFFKMGGTEVQSLREIDNFTSHGHRVHYLTFDPSLPKVEEETRTNLPSSSNVFRKFFRRFFVDAKMRRAVQQIIEKKRIDVIHINNVYSCPLSVYAAIRNSHVPAVQTVRDYYGVCFKATCVFSDWSECPGYRHHSCKGCAKGAAPWLKHRLFKKVISARLRTIKAFACPSQALTNKCKKNGYPIRTINNPFDFTKIPETPFYVPENRTFLYYGIISKNKGVFHLIEAIERARKIDPRIHLVFLGKIDLDEADKKVFEKKMREEGMEWRPPVDNATTLATLKDVYSVVVPSLWIENYPNTVLEPVCSKRLVIGSNRGGIPEMIGQSLVFDPLDVAQITEKILFVSRLSKDEYAAITRSNFERAVQNNNLETYYNKLLSLYKEILK